MTQPVKTIALGIIAGILLFGIGYGASWLSKSGNSSGFITPELQGGEELSSVRDTVTNFGGVLKRVSLLAPDAATQIEEVYAPYVAEELLSVWKADLEKAPGKRTSSPYPEGIEVVTITKNQNGSYTVNGNIREVTSTGVAGVLPVELILLNREGKWLITSYKEGDYSALPQRMTLTGVYTCLPHADTTGPQTMECALGMQTDDGAYYALDFNLMSQTPPGLETGDRFTATGVLTPIENLSTNFWQKYNVSGIFSVTDSVQRI